MAPMTRAKILLWHVHGSWTNAFVQGGHDYFLPVTPRRGSDSRGRARTWDWPDTVHELPVTDMRGFRPDLVVLQRPHEAELARRWTGRSPGIDVPAVYLEHNTPPAVPFHAHPLAGQDRIPIVHVTHFNRLMWDNGIAPTRVIEHGVPDPGPRYTGEIDHAAVVVNYPQRRGRAVGADLLVELSAAAPLDLFGMKVTPMAATPRLCAFEDLPQAKLHDELPRRAVYLHPFRWTSLGLSLIEAMLLGMPVVALDTTEASRAVPVDAGVVSNDVAELVDGVRRLAADPDLATAMGARARAAALPRYSLERFLSDWDDLLRGMKES